MNHLQYSYQNFFASATIDRSARVLGSNSTLNALVDSQDTKFLPIWNKKVLLLKNQDQVKKAEFTKHDISRFKCITAPVYIGYVGKSHYFATQVEPNSDECKEFSDLLHSVHLLNAQDAAVLGCAITLLSWRNDHKNCGLCGSPTSDSLGGNVLVCSQLACQHEHYPKIDPAIIVLVENQDQALFGRKSEWPQFRYSTIAGFVEAGESVEQAVVREVAEETGVEVAEVSYHSSQPWPFSNSLMLGYKAVAKGSTEIKLHDKELEHAQWLSREQLAKRLRNGKFIPPTSFSIAFRLIEEWFNASGETTFKVLCENNKTPR